MRARPPRNLTEWVIFFGGWTILFGPIALVAWWKGERLSDSEILVPLAAASGFLATGAALLHRWRRGR